MFLYPPPPSPPPPSYSVTCAQHRIQPIQVSTYQCCCNILFVCLHLTSRSGARHHSLPFFRLSHCHRHTGRGHQNCITEVVPCRQWSRYFYQRSSVNRAVFFHRPHFFSAHLLPWLCFSRTIDCKAVVQPQDGVGWSGLGLTGHRCRVHHRPRTDCAGRRPGHLDRT